MFFFGMFHRNSLRSLHYLQHTLLKVRALDKFYRLNISKAPDKIIIKIHWHSGSIKLGVILKNIIKFVSEIILTEEGSLKRLWVEQIYFTAINMTVKHNNLLKPIMGCLYVNFVGHVSVIHMTIIRSVRAKKIAMLQRSPERNGILLCFTLFSMMDIEL
jgi:hypothetical protein